MLSSIKGKSVINRISNLDEYVRLNKEVVMKLIEQPCGFNFNEKGELIVVGSDGEVRTFDSRVQKISDLQDSIP